MIVAYYSLDSIPVHVGGKQKWSAFCDKSMKLFMVPLHTIRFIFRPGAISDLIFDKHKRSQSVNYFRFDTKCLVNFFVTVRIATFLFSVCIKVKYRSA